MTKYITNKNNSLHYCFVDKNDKEQCEKIANYGIEMLFTLERTISTKNKYQKIESSVLRLRKADKPDISYIKILNGDDESDRKLFFKALHQNTVGLYEIFDNKKYLLLLQMLYQDQKSVKMYRNFGYQPSENIYVTGNKIFNHSTNTLEIYPKLPDNI